MPRIFKNAGKELRELFPVWLFFFLAFSLLRLTQSIILREAGFDFTAPSLVLVGSLIIAKVFLILDWFRFVERFKDRPLVFDVLWKTAIYFVGSFVFYCVEQLIEVAIKEHDLSLAWSRLEASFGTPRMWVLQLWLLVLLFAYTAARETILAMGKTQFMKLWFTRESPGV